MDPARTSPLRLLMLGTGPFAVPTFEALLESEHSVLALVTRPSVAAATRGKLKTPPNPMREVAQNRQLPILDPPSINDQSVREQLAAMQPDLLVVCDYGQILSPQALEVAPLGGINLHGSLLPKYRGAAPIQWAIWRGEQETGVTVIHMTPRLDAGPVLVQRTTPIAATETAEQLEPRLAQLGVDAVHTAIEMLSRWDRVSPIGTLQDPSQSSRAPRFKKSDGEVNWSRSASELYNQYRAVQPWPGFFSHFARDGKEPLRVIFETIEPSIPIPNLTPGMIASSDERALTVATANGSLIIRRLQPAGRRSMDAAEFLRGNPIQAGDRFV